MAISRRTVLRSAVGGAGAAGLAAVLGACGAKTHDLPAAARTGIPTAPQGTVRLEQVMSRARGRSVGLFTAVPAGHGDGAGLPVCLILHGASATTTDYEQFGFGRFLTAAVRAGAPPFVLAGADGGDNYWRPTGDDDPQRMLTKEMPGWLTTRGFDSSRLAAYGWSMGGYGTLYLAEHNPALLRAAAALSPAVATDDPLIAGVRAVDPKRLGIWCGLQDPLYPAVETLVRAVPGGPAIAHFAAGRHTRTFWNSITPQAFDFVGRLLGAAGPAGSPTSAQV
jgi:pimeloyl-ACP methyl ester carboxylesterase